MPDIDLHNAYNSCGLSVHDVFARQEEGFFVPEYQRDYTWEEENINRLFEDLVDGIGVLAEDEGDQATTFLGTAILTNEIDKKRTVKQGDDRAQPTAVKLVVDGQQRIATIALVAIQLREVLETHEAILPDSPQFEVLRYRSENIRDTLKNLYTFKTGLGAKPAEKPKIIREAEDRWELAGDDTSYNSPIARYIATYIRAGQCALALESLDAVHGARVIGNVQLIRRWLDQICRAHFPGSEQFGTFPIGSSITTNRLQEYILGFYDPDLGSMIDQCETDVDTPQGAGTAVYNLLLFAYYLLRRCGINQLQPTEQTWGFDMFQALNSTGTPLTALETFKPQVIQTSQGDEGTQWQTSIAKRHFDDIEELFERTRTNEQKNRRTNELLTAARLCLDGMKLGNKFSAQHKWIRNVYGSTLSTATERNEFLEKVAGLASFYYTAWYMEDENKPHLIRAIENHPEGELASMLVQYLRDASSDLSAPILARFFGQIPEGEHFADEFVEATKACAAFFTLWRTARSTAGLDEIYRRYFRGSQASVKVDSHCWGSGTQIVYSDGLKAYFNDVLSHHGLTGKESWITESERFLMYTEIRTVCRFVLFLAGDQRVPDPGRPGLTSQGNTGLCGLLNLATWRSKDLRSLEHVAPQSAPQGHTWDPWIYSESKVHHVGNLLLLPADINGLVDSKNWNVKFLHYSHIGSPAMSQIETLTEQAQQKGVALSKRAITKLSSAQYSCVIEPIMSLGIDGTWDVDFIDLRTSEIKEIAWDRLTAWLMT